MLTFDDLHAWVKDLPIIDWHNHLDLQRLAADQPLGSLYDVWVRTDPYKHRAMRICGEPEELITGRQTGEFPAAGATGVPPVGSEDARWSAWMRTLPKLVGNPIVVWARMELEFLGLDPEPYLHGCGANVSLAAWTPSKLLRAFGAEMVCPCLGAEQSGLLALGRQPLGRRASCPSEMKVVPSLRMNAGDRIADGVLRRFHAAGCRVVDVSVDDTERLESEFGSLAAVAAFAASRGWTMLLHLGALRETSARLRALAGPAGGFAGMRAPVDPADVARFLNRLESGAALPRTILLSLNPGAHAQLAVLAGAFNGAGVPGKVQLGPAWWWCDHEEGIRDVLEKNAAYGVLSTFVGMTTDSRSLLSFVRHDYFRRILCRWTAEKIASGAFPDDESLIRPVLENVCYRNARGMFAGDPSVKESTNQETQP